MLSLPLIAGIVAALGEFTDVSVAVVLTVAAVGAMGVGNGVILQLASEWFPKQIGLASGVVGAAGGIGGFLLPLWLGTLKEVTGSYRTGLWVFACGYGHCLGRGVAGRTTSTPNNQSHGSTKPFFSLTVRAKNNVKCAMLNDKLIIH